MPRLAPPRDPVTIHLDGEPLVAERGEPVAVALVAAGHRALARSPKFHRPRGPACLRGACDGCLTRIDDVPNVMACRVPCREGLRVETQNVIGSRDTDLLRVADWFFPEGMNHHELFAGVPGLQQVLQGFARRVAGVGKLPGRVVPPATARRRQVDALVVGTGPAGMAAALALARRGRTVELVDDDLAWGGNARLLEAVRPGPWQPTLTAFGALLADAGARVRVSLRTTAAGLYGTDVLVARDVHGEEEASASTAADTGEPGLEVLAARTLVLAPGAHDGALAFEGNDVPGVMSARAACRLLAHHVVPGTRIVVVCVEGGGPFGEAYASAFLEAGAGAGAGAGANAGAGAGANAGAGAGAGANAGAKASARTVVSVVRGVPIRVSGSARIKGVTIATAEGEVRIACDILLIDAPAAPAYELCAQAGAELSHEARGYLVRTGPGGRIGRIGALGEGVFAIGEAVGARLDPETLARAAAELAEESSRPG